MKKPHIRSLPGYVVVGIIERSAWICRGGNGAQGIGGTVVDAWFVWAQRQGLSFERCQQIRRAALRRDSGAAALDPAVSAKDPKL